MGNRRMDHKGRPFETGEGQRKDGRYVFTYYEDGKKKFLYSWRLLKDDPLPGGKRPDLSLREKEQRLKEGVEIPRGRTPKSSNLRVSELVRMYFDQKAGLSYNTVSSYHSLLKAVEENEIGSRLIREIKPSDAKIWFARLQREGRSYSFIRTIKAILQPAFQMAVEDEILSRNPFDFAMNKFLVNDRKRRIALSPEQEEDFLRFIREDDYYHRYADEVFLLFATGLRISEFAGLTKENLDFKRDLIRVDHQLIRVDGAFHVVHPKTLSGNRALPMQAPVRETFQRILRQRRAPDPEPQIEGVSGFLFLTPEGQPRSSHFWSQLLPRISRKYVKQTGKKLPPVTPHICRHTYCTKMARMGMNPKALQYLMGHSNISVTLDVYTHLQFEDAKEELERIGAMKGGHEKNKVTEDVLL